MRTSQFLLITYKETPTEAEIISHQLMLRSGMIRKNAAGIYIWLPLGLRTLAKVINIIREEMNYIGALEMLMPSIQPAELWKETDRWGQYGDELLRIKDRNDRDFCFGPTHEEVITDIARNELRSYKQLPLTMYQIQTKFRDERRPRFGVMRAREFLMKDAYSFHVDEISLNKIYNAMYEAYNRIFTRMGLKFRSVAADTGNIGGNLSHEFHVLADSGEEQIIFSDQSDYAVNSEIAKIHKVKPGDKSPDGKGTLQMTRGIEVGHIFWLGDKYSKAMNASVLDKDGKSITLQMGCYGIGVSRIVAAAIEQNNDEKGIIWPMAIAPFQIAIVPINMHRSDRVKKTAEDLYHQLQKEKYEVLFDDRNERAGVMFADMDLIGVPYQIIISDRGLESNTVEFKDRKTSEIHQIKVEDVLDFSNGFGNT